MSVTQQQVLDASGQGEVAARRRPDQCRCAVGDHRSTTARCFSRSMSMPPRRAPGKACARRPKPRCAAFPASPRAMVALTAERKAGPRRCSAAAASAMPTACRRPRRISRRRPGSGFADVEAIGNSRHRRGHRGGLRQGRRRQIDHRAQSGAGLARSRPARRPARCRYLRAVGAAADRHSREAALNDEQAR